MNGNAIYKKIVGSLIFLVILHVLGVSLKFTGEIQLSWISNNQESIKFTTSGEIICCNHTQDTSGNS